jgi:hypothetical protein
MPLQATLAYVKGLINGLAMPGGLPPLVAYVFPPSVDEEPFGEPRAYIWPQTFEESRNPERGGTVNRALAMPQAGESANSGTKPVDHSIHVYLIYDEDNDDEQGDSLFPSIIDAVSWQLRVSTDPAVIYDANTGLASSLIDVGETINGSITIRTLAGQRMYRNDCLLILPVMELIQS